MQRTPIQKIQGPGLVSPLSGQSVLTTGVVIGETGKGFFVQDPDGDEDAASSSGVFAFSPRSKPPIGSLVEIRGRVVDYRPGELERPTTQLAVQETTTLRDHGPPVEPVWLDARSLTVPADALARYLNTLEGMLVGIEKDAVFLAPSNPFGDYVVLPPGMEAPRTRHGGVLIEPANPQRWYPGFRIRDYSRAPQVNVGARLLAPVIGPLNYRASSFQIAALGKPRLRQADVQLRAATLLPAGSHVTILTLNGFNLDTRLEDPGLVNDPRRDVDDDVADGRYKMLASAIVREAACPDIVALQEMQDNDGAEITGGVKADRNYARLAGAVRSQGGPQYRWADIPPVAGGDGGQPGGNIRNGFLFNPERVGLVPGSLSRLGENDPAFIDSRKPLMGCFRLLATGAELQVVNVHLASKRHQNGIFAPENPGADPRKTTRIRQAELVAGVLDTLDRKGIDYYVTGDFNDFEFSDTLEMFLGENRVNLVQTVPEADRYDYNHRGVSQVLMHGVVSRRQMQGRVAEYEILHGNDLIGAQPGEMGGRPTDHAYVVARLELVAAGPSGG